MAHGLPRPLQAHAHGSWLPTFKGKKLEQETVAPDWPPTRQALRQKHQEAQQACRPHNLPVLQAAQQRELEAVEHRIREEQRAMDQKIVLELDRKVADQQSTLEKAGVAGFYVTTNPQELTLQMNLLELIRKLQQRGCQAGKAAL
ncbi:protein DGCR6 [Camelus ferus]|nr:protein DGCR6 [Camelus ferus]